MTSAGTKGFAIDARLAADSIGLGRLRLCAVRLIDDRRWPWLVLVPQRTGIVEWHDLTETDARQAAVEIRAVSAAIKAATGCLKVNVAALGNVVRQLHIHVVARSEGDPNWPGPVWGFGRREPYLEAERHGRMRLLGDRLSQTEGWLADSL